MRITHEVAHYTSHVSSRTVLLGVQSTEADAMTVCPFSCRSSLVVHPIVKASIG
jgi:hypothetical protein